MWLISKAEFLLVLAVIFAFGPECVGQATSDESIARTEHEFEKLGGIVYATYDDKQLECDVYMPKGAGPYPSILAIHGGAWRSGSKLHWSLHSRKLARAGYVVVTINYRHAPRYKYPAQIHDCKAAIRWMRENAEKYRIDVERIAAMGYSAGGQLAAMLGTTDSSAGLEGGTDSEISTRVQAVVAGGAPCDFTWIAENSNSLAYWLGDSRRNNPDVYRLASPIEFVSEDDPPFYFYHGAKDRLIPTESPRNMQQALSDAGIPTEIEIYDDSGHIETFSKLETLDGVIEFLDEHLGKDPAK